MCQLLRACKNKDLRSFAGTRPGARAPVRTWASGLLHHPGARAGIGVGASLLYRRGACSASRQRMRLNTRGWAEGYLSGNEGNRTLACLLLCTVRTCLTSSGVLAGAQSAPLFLLHERRDRKRRCEIGNGSSRSALPPGDALQRERRKKVRKEIGARRDRFWSCARPRGTCAPHVARAATGPGPSAGWERRSRYCFCFMSISSI